MNAAHDSEICNDVTVQLIVLVLRTRSKSSLFDYWCSGAMLSLTVVLDVVDLSTFTQTDNI